MLDEHELVDSFLKVAQLAHLTLTREDVDLEILPAPHRRPKSLPAGRQAVYSFFLGDTCLKVGKAGPKTAARFISQHYGFNAPSTLAKSIRLHRQRVIAACLPELGVALHNLPEDGFGKWIEASTTRANVLLPVTAGSGALSLLEAFLHCRFKPMFEGRVE